MEKFDDEKLLDLLKNEVFSHFKVYREKCDRIFYLKMKQKNKIRFFDHLLSLSLLVSSIFSFLMLLNYKNNPTLVSCFTLLSGVLLILSIVNYPTRKKIDDKKYTGKMNKHQSEIEDYFNKTIFSGQRLSLIICGYIDYSLFEDCDPNHFPSFTISEIKLDKESLKALKDVFNEEEIDRLINIGDGEIHISDVLLTLSMRMKDKKKFNLKQAINNA